MTDGGVIRWEDPPPLPIRTEAKRPWAIVAAELRARPGQWALIEIGANRNNMQARIAKGVSWFSPVGAFESCTRTVGDVCHTYARYVGEERP